MKSKQFLISILTTALTLNAGIAMATDMMVLESTPSELLPKGQNLTLKSGHVYHGQQKLVLTKEQTVTVMLCDGTTAVLDGVKPKVPQASRKGCHFGWFNSVADDLDTTTKPDGTKRGNGKTPNLWMIDVSTSATNCVRKGRIALWRPKENRQEAPLVITHQATPPQSVTMTWSAKRAILLWPSNMLVEEGGIYTAKLGEDKANSLTLYQLPSNISKNAQKLKWMAEKGCLSQARRFFDETADWSE